MDRYIRKRPAHGQRTLRLKHKHRNAGHAEPVYNAGGEIAAASYYDRGILKYIHNALSSKLHDRHAIAALAGAAEIMLRDIGNALA